MIESFIKIVLMVALSAIAAIILISTFDAGYRDLERHRREKWEAKQARRDHPANSGPRYE